MKVLNFSTYKGAITKAVSAIKYQHGVEAIKVSWAVLQCTIDASNLIQKQFLELLPEEYRTHFKVLPEGTLSNESVIYSYELVVSNRGDVMFSGNMNLALNLSRDELRSRVTECLVSLGFDVKDRFIRLRSLKSERGESIIKVELIFDEKEGVDLFLNKWKSVHPKGDILSDIFSSEVAQRKSESGSTGFDLYLVGFITVE